MRFWTREIIGWLLIAAGLYLFFVVYAILVTDRPLILESGPLTLIGIIVFRGGIHLIKVATAARICLHAHANVVKPHEPAPRRETAVRAGPPVDW
ncbi:MAG: hypothetical protein L0215_14775 [Gemmataceae bacterium]|nr:hypothetical protein [Gemmataceae bacterium]MCI0643171.1 hypothetical protein [Gemmataceae bacterium]